MTIPVEQTLEIGAPARLLDAEAGIDVEGTVIAKEVDLDQRERVRATLGAIPQTSGDAFAELAGREDERVGLIPPDQVPLEGATGKKLSEWQSPADPNRIDGSEIRGVPGSAIEDGTLDGAALEDGALGPQHLAPGGLHPGNFAQDVIDFIRGTGGEPILRPVSYLGFDDELRPLIAKAERLPDADLILAADPLEGNLVRPMSQAHTYQRSPGGGRTGPPDTLGGDQTKPVVFNDANRPVPLVGTDLERREWMVGVNYFIDPPFHVTVVKAINGGWTFMDGKSRFLESFSAQEPWSTHPSFVHWTTMNTILPINMANCGPWQRSGRGVPRAENPAPMMIAVEYTIESITPHVRNQGGPGLAWATIRGIGPGVGSNINPGGDSCMPWTDFAFGNVSTDSMGPWRNRPGKYVDILQLRTPAYFRVHPTLPWPAADDPNGARFLSERKDYWRYYLACSVFAEELTITDPVVRLVGLASDPEYRAWAGIETRTEDWESEL